jgi:hypothetical protein
MSFNVSYLKSLCLTVLFSFTTPLMMISSGLLGLRLLGWVPGLEPISQTGVQLGITFLSTFGTGNPWHGMLVIGSTWAVVGALFDVFCRQQSFRRIEH